MGAMKGMGQDSVDELAQVVDLAPAPRVRIGWERVEDKPAGGCRPTTVHSRNDLAPGTSLRSTSGWPFREASVTVLISLAA